MASWVKFLCLTKSFLPTHAVSQFRVCILRRMHLKANYITTPCEGCPNSKAPPNAAFFSLFLEDAPLLSFVASHIPRFFVCLKKEERKRENSDTAGVDCHFRGPGWQKLWRKCKDGNIWWRYQEILQRLNRPIKPQLTWSTVKGLSEGLAFENCKGRVLRRMQTLTWDTANRLSHSLHSASWLPPLAPS